MIAPRFSILVVEDDGPTRRGLQALLTAAGYDVIAVHGYPEGRQALRAGRYDLLLTDLRLREFNGLHLVLMTPPAIPAIVLTGFPDPVIEREARRLGATFIVKPIAPDRLLALIAQRLAPPQPAGRAALEPRTKSALD
jgi:two-component system response regulator HydG